MKTCILQSHHCPITERHIVSLSELLSTWQESVSLAYYVVCLDPPCISSPLPNTLSSSAANSCYGCSEAGSVAIEGPLRRKTLLKEGRKPKVHRSLIWLCFPQIQLTMSANWKGVIWREWVRCFSLLCCSYHRGADFGSLCLDRHWHSMGPKHWGPLRGNMWVWCLNNMNLVRLCNVNSSVINSEMF